MKRITIWKYCALMTILFSSYTGITVFSQISVSEAGMVDVLLFDHTIDNTGTEDVTIKLRDAFQAIANLDKTAYLPSGTYKVSGTIKIENQEHIGRTGCADRSGKGSVNIYGDPVDPPLLLLTSGSFTNSSIPSPVLKVWKQDNDRSNHVAVIGQERTACNYFVSLRNLKFDLQNNPGGSAIDFGAAQDCNMADIYVSGEDFHSGFMGLPGANQANVNLTVIGGRYGLWMNGALAEGTTLTGLTLHGQSINAIYLEKGSYRGNTFTGLDIRDCAGIPIVINAYNSGGGSTNGHLTIIDSRIEMKNESLYAIDRKSKAISLIDVYVKGSSRIVSGSQKNYISESLSGNWTQVAAYNYTPNIILTDEKTVHGFNIINGNKLGGGQEIINAITNSSAPPANLISKHQPHLPSNLPTGQTGLFSFKSPGTVSINDFKTSSNTWTEAFQAALNSSATIIYVPGGSYTIDQLLDMPVGKVLVGDPGYRSKLVPDYTIINASSRCWMLTTENTQGYASIQDIRFNTADREYLGALHWRHSDGFMFGSMQYNGSGHSEQNKHNWEFSGNAGGKIYGLADQNNLFEGKIAHPEFRKVFMNATSNSITFYGLNLERGGGPRKSTQYPFFEAINSRNFRIFGTKTETYGIVYRTSNSSNFIMTNIMSGNAYTPPLIDISASCNDFLLSIIVVKAGVSEGSNLISDGSLIPTNMAKKPEFVGWYSKGSFNHSAFTGGIETSAITSQTLLPVTLFPNPVDDFARITLPQEVNNAVVKILSIEGKVMKQLNIYGNTGIIPLEGLKSPGLYLVRVTMDYNTVTVKMVLN